MKNKIVWVLLIIFSLTLVTACEKKDDEVEVVKSEKVEKAETKELNCRTDMTATITGSTNATFGLSLVQDSKTYQLTSGEATIIVDYTGNATYSEEALTKALPDIEKSFCANDFFGANTTKSCKMTSEGQTITAIIEIDVDAFLVASGVSKDSLNSTSLNGLKESLEKDETYEYKCSVK